MKYVIDIIEVVTKSEDWTNPKTWPGPGLYQVKGETYSIFHVYDSGVNYISSPDIFRATKFQDPGESVSETLLLKAIAAASRAEVLK